MTAQPALQNSANSAQAQGGQVSQTYFETVQLIERMHRQFLDVLKIELETEGIQDINNVQTLILYNIGTDELTVGELTVRGYYLGSNVSYNVKKMVENEYLLQERSIHDRRSVRVKLSEKGLALKKKVDGLFEKHATALGERGIQDSDLKDLTEIMRKLERFWSNRASAAGYI